MPRTAQIYLISQQWNSLRKKLQRLAWVGCKQKGGRQIQPQLAPRQPLPAFGYAQFMVGRCLLGVGISFTCIAGPSMVAELAHPRQRGTVLGFFNTFWYVDAIVAAWGSFGSGHMNNSWSWRISSLIQGVAPCFLIAMLPFMPESPRWLLAKGRADEARQVLAECGQGVISYYFSPLLTSLNVTGTNQQTGINGGMQIWNFLVSIAGACLADRIGRRSLWLISLVAMICSNIGITITSAVFDKNGADAAVYMAILFLFYTTLASTLLATHWHTHIPLKSCHTACEPKAIGWKYWLFFLGMLVLFLAMVYFTYTETKGLTLEELASLFEDEESVNMMEKMDGIEPEVETVPIETEKKE
ncbi:MFS general substrate transporter [Stipitochalara longipes BDJ]|nr:MFS general substrate transporter [Stipitochalara longipes BDJ]